MDHHILTKDKDPMGAAIAEYHRTGRAGKLIVHSPQFDDDEIPVKTLFRKFAQMPALEKETLKMAGGRILDVGGGSGCHSLALQEMGKEVCAIDISPLSVETMQERGVKDARLVNLFDPSLTDTFDTILMLMNGSGIIGRIAGMGEFFVRIRQMLRPGGCVLMDSSDLKYLFEEEDGSFLIDIAGSYYGEVDFSMQYKGISGDPFSWLYVDFQTLSLYAAEYGFEAELVREGAHYNYLAKLTSKKY
jgi:SAM-dependent methyltransferase